jgi:hypothetical protein
MTSAHYMFCQLFDEMFTQYWRRALFAQSASGLWRALGFSAANIVTAVPPEHICSMPMTTLLEENHFLAVRRSSDAPGLGAAQHAVGQRHMQKPRHDVGVKNHHPHRRRRGNVARVVHIQYRD